MRCNSGRFLGAMVIMGLLASVEWGSAAEPQRGGHVRWFTTSDPVHLDPHLVVAPGDQQVVVGLYSGLLQYDPQRAGEVMPDLAERWERTSDGRVYTFYLRQGVQWHDGEWLTAADVRATFTRLLAPSTSLMPCGTALRPLIKRVEVLGDNTVRFHLRSSAAFFLSTLASSSCAITAAHALERHGDQWRLRGSIGTGPFRLQEHVRGERIVWERNPTYYDARYPYIDRVTHTIFPDQTRPFIEAQFGRVHLWTHRPPLSPYKANELKQRRGDGIEVYQQPLNTVWAVHLNPHRAPFDQPAMRRAVHLALDRQALFEAAYAGEGVPCAILDPAVYGKWALPIEEVNAVPGCRQPKTADIAQARALVASVYPDGVTVDITVRVIGDYLERAQLIVSQLRKIGIDGRIKAYESLAGWQRYHQRKFAVIGTQDTSLTLSDPSAPFDILFASEGRHQWSQWEDDTVDQWVTAGKRELDAEKRQHIYHLLQRYLLTADSPTVIVGWVSGWFFHDKVLQNYTPSYATGPSPRLQRVWLNSSELETQTVASQSGLSRQRPEAMAQSDGHAMMAQAAPPAVLPQSQAPASRATPEPLAVGVTPPLPSVATSPSHPPLVDGTLGAEAPPTPAVTPLSATVSPARYEVQEVSATMPAVSQDRFVSALSIPWDTAPASLRGGAGIGLVTGPRNGTYFRLGQDIARVAARVGVAISVSATAGSIDNLRYLKSRDNASLGIVQSDMMSLLEVSENAAAQGLAERLRLIFPLHTEEVHLLARSDIQTMSDLDGKRVAVGSKRTGGWFTALNLLQAFHVQPSAVIDDISTTKALKAVLRGEIDALFYVAGKPVRLFQRMAALSRGSQDAGTASGVHFVSLGDALVSPEYVASDIGPADYSWMQTTVQTVAVQALLVSFDDTRATTDSYVRHCRYLAQVSQAIRNHFDTLQQTGHDKWQEADLDGAVALWQLDPCAHGRAVTQR